MIKPQITTLNLRARYHTLFSTTYTGTPILSANDGSITGAVLTTAQVITDTIAGYTICLKGIGYAEVVSIELLDDDAGTEITLDTTSYAGNTGVNWCVSVASATESEAFDQMKHNIIYGCDATQELEKEVEGMLFRTGKQAADVDFLDKIDADSTLFNIAHQHLALHLIMRDSASLASETFEKQCWLQYDQYLKSLNNAIDALAHSLEDDYPSSEPDKIIEIDMTRV